MWQDQIISMPSIIAFLSLLPALFVFKHRQLLSRMICALTCTSACSFEVDWGESNPNDVQILGPSPHFLSDISVELDPVNAIVTF
jgi:hypothetical protein